MTEKEMRELDAWIAERVMGWRNFKLGVYGAGAPERKPTLHGTPPTRKAGVFSIPHYTTDPAAAMHVLEKCIELKASPCFDKDNAGNFEIACVDSECQAKFLVRAYTLPLAIALFARKLYETKT